MPADDPTARPGPGPRRPGGPAATAGPGRGRRPAGPRLRVVRVRRPAAGAPDAVRVLPHVLHTTGEEADRVR